MDSSAEIRRRIAVVAVIIDDGKFLTIKRSQTVRAPGKICFPGGSVENDETETVAVQRELVEELGVQVQPRQKIFSNRSPWGVQLNWWTAELLEQQIPVANPDEVAQVQWMTYHELRQHPDLLASNIVFLDAIKRREVLIDGLMVE